LIPDIDGMAWFARWMQSAGIGSVFACCFAQILPLEVRLNTTNLRLTDRQVQLLLYYCQSASLCRDQGAELINLKATQASCMLESYLCWSTDFQPASKLTFWQCAAKIEVMHRRLLQIQTPRFDLNAPGAAASAPNELAVRADAQTMLGSLKSLCEEFNHFSEEQQGLLQLRLAHIAAVMADMAVATDLIKRAMLSFQNSNQCGISQVREGHAMLGAIEIMAGRFNSAQVSLNSSIRLARSSDDAYTERAAATLQTIILLLQWSSSSAPEVQGEQMRAMALLETLVTGAGRCSSRARRDQLPESDAKQGIRDSHRVPREFESSNESVETILARTTRTGAARGNRDSRDGAGVGAEVGFVFCMALDEYLKSGSESAIVARLRATMTATQSEQWAQLQCWQSFIEFALVCVLVLKAAEARCSAMGAARFRNENTYTSNKSAPVSERESDHVFLELMSQAALVCAFLGSWGHRFPLVAPFARAASSWCKWIGVCGGAQSGSELGDLDNAQSVATRTVNKSKSMDAVQRRHALLNCIDELGRAEAAFAASGLELFRAIVGTWHARAHCALKSIVAMVGPVQTMHQSLSSTACDQIIKNAARLHCAIGVSAQHPFFELPHADLEIPLGECAYACRQS
jgi:hypothetical protein